MYVFIYCFIIYCLPSSDSEFTLHKLNRIKLYMWKDERHRLIFLLIERADRYMPHPSNRCIFGLYLFVGLFVCMFVCMYVHTYICVFRDQHDAKPGCCCVCYENEPVCVFSDNESRPQVSAGPLHAQLFGFCVVIGGQTVAFKGFPGFQCDCLILMLEVSGKVLFSFSWSCFPPP